jgi:hypothetical protein
MFYVFSNKSGFEMVLEQKFSEEIAPPSLPPFEEHKYEFPACFDSYKVIRK